MPRKKTDQAVERAHIACSFFTPDLRMICIADVDHEVAMLLANGESLLVPHPLVGDWGPDPRKTPCCEIYCVDTVICDRMCSALIVNDDDAAEMLREAFRPDAAWQHSTSATSRMRTSFLKTVKRPLCHG